MAERVVLHVGAMKTGTTFLQNTLFANQDRLARQGILVPGREWMDQVDAVLDLIGQAEHPTGERLDGCWERMVAEVSAWPGTAVLSVELLAAATPDQIARAAAALGPRIDVVLSLRDLNRSVPAMWQETVQNGKSWTWERYLAGVARGRPRPRRRGEDITPESHSFWRQQAAVRIAQHWSAAGPLHLVTVPRPGAPAGLLLHRFADVVGFAADDLDTSAGGNASLGAASTEMLRRLNAVLDARGLPFPAGIFVRKRHLAKQILPAYADREPRIGAPVLDWVEEHAAGQVAGLQALDPCLHGEWEDLRPSAVPGIVPSSVGIDQVAGVAVAAHRDLRAFLGARYAAGAPADDGLPSWSSVGVAERDADEGVEAIAGLVEWARRRTRARARV